MARYSLFVLKVPLNTNKPNQTVSILCPLPSTGWFQCRDGVGWYPGVIPRLCAVVDKRLVATSWLGRLQSGKCARCWCRGGGNDRKDGGGGGGGETRSVLRGRVLFSAASSGYCGDRRDDREIGCRFR